MCCEAPPPLLLKREGERVLTGLSTPHSSVFWFFEMPPPFARLAGAMNFCVLLVLAYNSLIRGSSAFLAGEQGAIILWFSREGILLP